MKKELDRSINAGMSRRKLKHFAEMKDWTHVYEPSFEMCLEEAVHLEWLAPVWTEENHPTLLIELACGYGVYALALAQNFPTALVVGVDIKGSRLWHGAKSAEKLGLVNTRFLRARIEALDRFLPSGQVDELWITFPDPHPTKGNAKRRLTSPRFLELYARLLKKEGLLHLKTDDEDFFRYSLASAEAQGFFLDEKVEDVHGTLPEGHFLKVLQTHYEKKHLQKGKTIYYARWRVPA